MAGSPAVCSAEVGAPSGSRRKMAITKLATARQRGSSGAVPSPSDPATSAATPPTDLPGEGDALTDAELRDQFVTLLLAGHETTATALAWSFHELARDPAQLATAERGRPCNITAVPRHGARILVTLRQ